MTHRRKYGCDCFVMMYTPKQWLKSYNTFKKIAFKEGQGYV